MYLYVYDAYVQDPKFEGTLAKVENRLLELGINGKVERLSYLKSPSELILDGLKRGARTVVAVGNDDTFKKVLTAVAPFDVVIGIIPIGERSRTADVFGVGHEEKACDTLSMRLVQSIDLLQANNHFVLSSIHIPARQMVTVEFDQKFRVTPMQYRDEVTISNLGPIFDKDPDRRKQVHNPQDGVIEAEFRPIEKSLLRRSKSHGVRSMFHGKTIKVYGRDEKVNMIADLNTKVTSPLTVRVLPKAQKIVVGKKRKF